MFLVFVAPIHEVLFWISRLPLSLNPTHRNHTGHLLLVLYATSTDQENGCQASKEWEMQNVVVLYLA